MKEKWTAKEKLICASGIFIVCLCLIIEGISLRAAGADISVGSMGTVSDDSSKKIAFLTFDDGPSCLTEGYLDILKEEGVHATFFIIGQQVDDDTDAIIRREIEEGHELGVHTYCHEANKIYSTSDACFEDIMKIRTLLETKYEYKPKFVRFPWGSANSYISSFRSDIIARIEESGMDYVDWNVSAEDSVGTPTVYSIMNNIRKDYSKYDEPVILMHDSGCNKMTLEALKDIIKELKDKGYSFGTLSERSKSCHFLEKRS